MGWLGWTWEVAARTDVNVIELALEGRTGLLEMIFGSWTPKAGGSPMTPERFRSFAERHNRRYAQKRSAGSSRRGK